MTRKQRLVIASAVVALCAAGAGALGFGPLVRRAANERAARYGASVTIAEVRPTWRGVRLSGVDVSFADAPHVTVKGATVEIVGGRLGPVESVTLSAATVSAGAAPDVLRRELEAVAARGKREPSGGGEAKREVVLSAAGLSASVDLGDAKLSAQGVGVSREGATTTLVVASATAEGHGFSGTVADGRLVLRRGGEGTRVAELRAREAQVTRKVDKDAAAPAVAAPPSAERSIESRLAELRHKAHGALVALAAATTDDVALAVERASFTLDDPQGGVHVGPGALTVTLLPDSLQGSFQSPKGESGSTPLGVTVELPRASEKELVLGIAGGPVSLATLGLRDKDQGLFDVGAATVEASGKVRISSDGKHVEADLSGKAKNLSVEHKRLAQKPVKGLAFGFRFVGGLDTDLRHVRVDTGDLELGTVHVEGAGELKKKEKGFDLVGRLAVPLGSCQGALDALPEGLVPHVHGMKMSGAFALKGGIAYDSEKPDRADIQLALTNECRVTEAPKAVDLERVRGPFRRLVYAPDGKRVEVDTGPGTPGWVPIQGVSPFMEAAVLTCEDGAFRRHRGFDVEAIRNSIRENLKAGRFVRGASTISMQTAKNLWLDRDKTLGRKLEEAILTSYLEQSLSKEQILELYLNIIEYGPMVYGIGPASGHYFRTGASNLSLGQALYLASILPNPKVQHFGGDGRVSNAWMGYLHRLMRGMVKRGLIQDADMTEGLAEWVVFGQSKPARIEPVEEGIRLADPLGVPDGPPPKR